MSSQEKLKISQLKNLNNVLFDVEFNRYPVKSSFVPLQS